VREEDPGPHTQQHQQSPAHILAHLWILVPTNCKHTFNERDYVCHEGSWHGVDELVDTGNRIGPDGGAVVGEQLDELGHEDVQRPVKSVAVELVTAIFTDLV
jgi:hypothetical protein